MFGPMRNNIVHLPPTVKELFHNNSGKLSRSVLNILSKNKRITNLEYNNNPRNPKITGKINGAPFTIDRQGEIYGNVYLKNIPNRKNFQNLYILNGNLQPGNKRTSTGAIVREPGTGFKITKINPTTNLINRKAVVKLAENIINIVAQSKFANLNKQKQKQLMEKVLMSIGRQSSKHPSTSRALGAESIRNFIANRGFNTRFNPRRYLPNGKVLKQLEYRVVG
jgi:hypothetical protein